MSEEMIIRNCSPTLAGMKTGNLFSCDYRTEQELRDAIRRYNQMLRGKGLRVLPLRKRDGRALIYIYRPDYLSRDFQHREADRLLRERGYHPQMPQDCVRHLIRRLGEQEEFPHEIGLFLGYPPEDVCGFIENRAEGCKCVGCWKVYGDAQKAKKTFQKYKKCTDIYWEHYTKGTGMESLALTNQ